MAITGTTSCHIRSWLPSLAVRLSSLPGKLVKLPFPLPLRPTAPLVIGTVVTVPLPRPSFLTLPLHLPLCPLLCLLLRCPCLSHLLRCSAAPLALVVSPSHASGSRLHPLPCPLPGVPRGRLKGGGLGRVPAVYQPRTLSTCPTSRGGGGILLRYGPLKGRNRWIAYRNYQ